MWAFNWALVENSRSHWSHFMLLSMCMFSIWVRKFIAVEQITPQVSHENVKPECFSALCFFSKKDLAVAKSHWSQARFFSAWTVDMCCCRSVLKSFKKVFFNPCAVRPKSPVRGNSRWYRLVYIFISPSLYIHLLKNRLGDIAYLEYIHKNLLTLGVFFVTIYRLLWFCI